ncbi:hypothetical protein [Rhizobium sp. AB2/73]|uniref:hypothetical protein n=1 Tax=Rhizobium sp. AB2/73 TaxID=2795216 RepID=UPI001C5F3B14|nr:hypothetical protein [Rhizobium sp. AB2/73]QYA13686.1 hypothetical protein J5284_05560 [Rhizobium sp. AB2/73]UEQ80384.1 hypothetical protein I8E17_16440 [Rhizobium sp. AB2/73]
MTDDPDKPKLSVVSQRSQKQIDTEHAQDRFDRAVIEMAANVIRIVRGAGKPHEFIKQCADIVNLAVDFDDVAGRFPSDHSISGALDTSSDPIDYDDEYWAFRQIAHRQMIRGALQVASCRLVGQGLQERSGKNEMEDAFETMIRAVDDLRKRREAEKKVARMKALPRKKVTKKKRTKKELML